MSFYPVPRTFKKSEISNKGKATEVTYRDENEAHQARRDYIMRNRKVSLISYDSNRNLYAFDVYSK